MALIKTCAHGTPVGLVCNLGCNTGKVVGARAADAKPPVKGPAPARTLPGTLTLTLGARPLGAKVVSETRTNWRRHCEYWVTLSSNARHLRVVGGRVVMR